MAPTKRPHALLEAGMQEEVLDTRQARSNLSQDATAKRARLSKSARDEDSSSESEDNVDADGDDNERGRRNSPPRTQYEIARDDGFRHLQYEDQDDQRATQKIKNRPQRIGENHAAENGIIESVECINFMCHERLFVELGPLINFIVGENGSGKSAVLTALTLCLGGKASSTNRGGSLKSFIKEGRDNSVIIVRIKNQGVDAYQPDIYGETIRVERHFSRAGASGFKLKSVTGKTISTKKADVDEISEYWALQVDNPLNVLSQDNARQFLNSSSASMKYKFFVRGVQLEQLDNDYKLLTEILESHEAKLPTLEEHVRRAEREYSEARRLRDMAEKNEEMRKQYRRLRNQLYWSQVTEQEDILRQCNDEIAALDENIRSADSTIEQKSQALTQCDEQLNAAKEALHLNEQEVTTVDDEVNNAKKAYDDAKSAVTDIHHLLRDVQQRHKIAKQQVTDFEQKIRAEEQRLGAGAGSARQEQERMLDEAKTEEAHILAELDTYDTSTLPDLRAKVSSAQKSEIAAKGAVSKKKEEVAAAELRLENLRRNRGSTYAAWDRNIPQLLQAIERDTGFEEKPVGPLGAHIQLLRPDWSSILETLFGATLDSFLVANKRDQQRLAKLMQRFNMNRQPPIIIGKRLPPNLSLREPDPEFNTVLRVLKFDNDWVRSQLIVAHSIDKIILIENRSKADEVMMGASPPPNVQVCLTFHDGEGKRGHGLRIQAKESSASSSPIYPFNRQPRMKSDNETQVKLQEEALSHLRGELRSLETEQRQLLQASAKCQAHLDAQTKQKELLEVRRLKAQSRIDTITTELDQYDGVDGRLVSLREELEKSKAEKDHQGTQYGEMRLRQEELNKQVEQCKEAWSEERRKHKDAEAYRNKLQVAVQRAEDLRKLAVMEKNRAFEDRDNAMEDKRRAEAKRDDQAEVVANFTQQAMEKAPNRVYIEEGETHKSIEAKYASIHQQLERRAQRLGASDEEIKDRAAKAESAYESAKQLYQGQQDEQAAGKLNLEDRLNRWRLFQRHISARARICFQYLLSERGFRGKLAIDHPQRRLSLFVEPDETKKGTSGRSTKTLSGGEKSFSSICMLLAIWEAMGSPLRCLDEFDVFMDNVNRKISTNMLITAARRSVSRQYIMITPNAIEGRASLDKDVKIIRLTDPRQRTLV